MRTSRIAKDAAKIANILSPSKSRRTRASLATAIHTFNPTAPEHLLRDDNDNDDDDSSLSSVQSDVSFDTDTESKSLSPRKRKRRNDTSTSATTLSDTTVTVSKRTSPRKKKVKFEEEVEIEEAAGTKVKKARRQPAKQTVNPCTGDVEIHPPANWEEVYELVREMRKQHLAPVDTMGCERLADEKLTPKDQRFQTLIALMLSSQTKDTVTAVVHRRLQTSLPPPGLTLPNILALPASTLNTLIHQVGFHNNKTRYIKAVAEILTTSFDGDIPDTIDGLMSLPGVGPKMAYLCMSSAWGRTEGIGVDVHVHRITNLWGWHKTKGPEETRKILEAWLPKEKWHEINHLLVGFGQTICAPVGRRCGECTLAERGLCPGAVVDRKVKVKRVRVKGEETGGLGGVDEGEAKVKTEKEVEEVKVKVEVEETVAGDLE